MIKSSNHSRLKKLLRSQIPLNNDVFMVFANNKRFCQEFLRVILQDKGLKVIDNEVQKYLPSAFNKNEEVYLTKQDIFKKGSTVYEVDMNIVSDQKEIISKWDAGLKVYYVNTKGLTNKNINEYLKLLTDRTTVSKKYKQTSSIKQEIYEIGGAIMSKEMREILDSERAEGMAEGMAKGKIESFLSLVKKGLLELSVAAKELGMSESQFKKLVNS